MNNLQNNQKSDATPMGYDTLLAAVPERKDMDYDKVRTIGKEQYCIKGISCNFCDFMDREKGKINNCVQEYVKRHCS
jgi:hypothetical protein